MTSALVPPETVADFVAFVRLGTFEDSGTFVQPETSEDFAALVQVETDY